jgi:hypothetical protein
MTFFEGNTWHSLIFRNKIADELFKRFFQRNPAMTKLRFLLGPIRITEVIIRFSLTVQAHPIYGFRRATPHRLSPLTIRVRPRFPFRLSGGTLTAGGECPNEKVIDSFPIDLCPADHSGLSRSWLFTLRYPAPVPIPILHLRAKILPSTRL